jgi:hypothetical protein
MSFLLDPYCVLLLSPERNRRYTTRENRSARARVRSGEATTDVNIYDGHYTLPQTLVMHG